jgi:hypothetical protein
MSKNTSCAGCSNSKAVGAPPRLTALPSSPYVPCSWTAFVGLSRPGSEGCAASSLSSQCQQGRDAQFDQDSIASALKPIYRQLQRNRHIRLQKNAPTWDACRGEVWCR